MVQLEAFIGEERSMCFSALVSVQALYSIEPRATSRAYGELEALQSALLKKPGRLFDDVTPSDLQM
jgi:hypothetical protein